MRIILDEIKGATVELHEVISIENDKQFVSIWPGDSVKIRLKNGNAYKGKVAESINTDYIKIMVSPDEVIKAGIEELEQIEILEYSMSRPENDRGNTAILEELKCEMIKKLDAIHDSYFGFVEGIWIYSRVSMKRYNAVMNYLDSNTTLFTSDVIKFVLSQDDFHEDSAVNKYHG